MSDKEKAAEEKELTAREEVAAAIDAMDKREPEDAEEPPVEAAEEEAPEEVEAAPEEAEEVEPEASEPEEPPATVAPAHWSAEDRAAFEKLPGEARGEFLRMYGRMQSAADERFEAAADARKFREEVRSAFAPYDEGLRQLGLDHAAATKQLLGMWQQSSSDPVGFMSGVSQRYSHTLRGTDEARQIVRTVAQNLGVDLGTPQAKPNGHDQLTPDAIQRMVDERFQTQAQQAQQREYSTAASQAQNQIRAFADAKDDAGNPKYPHFQAVKSTMGALMQAAQHSGGQMPSLEDAYHQAVWTQPALREQLTKAQQEAAARTAAEQRRETVAKARKAATPRTASRPIPPEDPGDLPVKELVARLATEHGIGGAG